MTWETIFDGDVLGDHITVEKWIDSEDSSYQPVRVKATDKNPSDPLEPIIEPGSIIFPPSPNDPSKRYTTDYESIEDMLSEFANKTGRTDAFTDALKKAMHID